MLISLLSSLALAGQAAPLSASNYAYDGTLVAPAGKPAWSDEFDGTALDRRKWSYDTSRNKEGWYNGERQYYAADRSKNLRVENGRLVISAFRERLDPRRTPDWGGQDYTSAKIISRGAGWRYGFVEVRAKLPCARGTWPAIWMMPVNGKEWPDDGEIDIMEQVGSEPNVVHATLHSALFNHVRKTQRGAQLTVPTSCTEFHNYQMDWRPDSIVIGVDGKAYMRVRNDQPGGKGAWPFTTPFNMILNLAIGGDWAASKGIDDAAMPQRMEVDYVRIWQRRSPGKRQ